MCFFIAKISKIREEKIILPYTPPGSGSGILFACRIRTRLKNTGSETLIIGLVGPTLYLQDMHRNSNN